jgi:hypothetical protein
MNLFESFIDYQRGSSLMKIYIGMEQAVSRRNLSNKERIYSYRLSSARRVVKSAFGILVSKFRIFEKPISLKLETVDKVVVACCALHNWLKKTNPRYIPSGLTDYEDENHRVIAGSWRQLTMHGLQDLPRTHIRHAHLQAEQIRARYCNYFNNEGSVRWQNKVLRL